MADLAELGIRVRSEEVAVGDERLEAFAASAMRAEGAVDGLAASTKTGGAAVATMNSAVRQQDMVLRASRSSMGLTVQEGLNFSRQFADIGVTAAMGMNPLMIALQQGPQLFDIFQMAAIRTGQTVGQVARQMAADWAAALWPILPIIAAIGLAIGTAGAAFGLATRDMSRDVGDLREGLSLTEDQLKRLEETGEKTTLTMGDYFRGLGTTIKEMFQETFGPQLDWVGQKWSQMLDFMTTVFSTSFRIVLTVGAGTYNALKATWSMLPAAMGDIAVSAANAVIAATEGMLNRTRIGINAVLGAARQLGQVPGFEAFGASNAIPDMGAVTLGRVSNEWRGQASAVGGVVVDAYKDAWRDVGAWQTEFNARLMANARASGQARLREAAGDGEAASGAGRDRAEDAAREVFDRMPRIDLSPLAARVPEITTHLELLVDELRLVNDLAEETAQGMASAFGESGRALGDLMTVMTAYQSRMAEIDLAEREHRLNAGQAERERAMSQVQNYGDMAAAARGFFKEGSDGYNALLVVEQVYRAFQFASMIQSMAMGGQETAASIANSLAKGAASTAAGAAKMFEFLGPFGFPAVAAMLALLVGLGISSSGGGGAKPSAAANDNDPNTTTDAVRAMNARDQQGRDASAAAVASRLDVRVTADRDGLNAYVVNTANREAAMVAAPMVAAAAAGTKKDVFDTLRGQQAGDRRITI